jgi:hypothetical protein
MIFSENRCTLFRIMLQRAGEADREAGASRESGAGFSRKIGRHKMPS